MAHIEGDVIRNILYLVLKGFMKADEVEEAANRTIFEASRLTTGFCAINDIREFKPTDPASVAHIQRAQAYIFKLGVKRVYRVVGKMVLGKLQFQKAQKDANAEYEVIEVASMEEAERHIANNP